MCCQLSLRLGPKLLCNILDNKRYELHRDGAVRGSTGAKRKTFSTVQNLDHSTGGFNK